MRTLLIGVAAAGFVAAVTSANAAEPTSTTDQGSSATPAPADKSSATQTPPSNTGTAASASKELTSKELTSKELSGVVKKVDKDKRSLKVLSSAGVEQDVKIAPSATITRDGTQVAELEQLKEGDEVRASFDPSSNQATKLDVQSSEMKDKGKSEMKSETKTESKAK